MEIPYIVEPRKDTGLNNSKIAIWLFLASEVMLFGGLFSAYIFLRVYADYPWPERALPVLPGLINTFILIASSVTVLLAWAGLKLRKWGMFVGCMTFTIICAAVFMVLKAREYSGKLHHHAVQYQDYGFLEGHVHVKDLEVNHSKKHGSEKVKASHATGLYPGDKGNNYALEAKSWSIFVGSSYEKYVNHVLHLVGKDVPLLTEDFIVREYDGKEKKSFKDKVLYPKGTPLTLESLDVMKDYYLATRTEDQKLRTQLTKEAWNTIRTSPEYEDLRELSDSTTAVKNALTKEIGKLNKRAADNSLVVQIKGNVSYSFAPGTTLFIPTKWGVITNKKQGESANIALLDKSVLSGVAGDSSIDLTVDGIDFRHLVMKAKSKGKDADLLIERSPILHLHGAGGEKLRSIWNAHKQWRSFFAKELKAKGLKKDGSAKYVPTAVDNYRVTWRQMVSYARVDYKVTKENWKSLKGFEPSMWYDMTNNSSFEGKFPHVHVKREDLRFDSAFSPKMNNYYAIYFTVTGLHGLHVIGGALVLAYYLLFGRKMYLSNPEWLANRVEVGGLFWHFVDLVWIFVFPIFYLM